MVQLRRPQETPRRLSGLRARTDLRNERGSILVLMTFAMAALIGVAALTLDLGRYYEFRRQLQNAADAAAHAAALQLPDQPLAESEAQYYFDLNAPSIGDSQFVVSFAPGDEARVRVEATGSTEFFLLPFFGLDHGDAAVAAEVGATPKDLAVVLDRSGSMCNDSHPSGGCPDDPPVWEPFNSVQSAANDFAALFSPTYDRFALASYSTSASLDLQLNQDFGAGSPFESAVNDLSPDGYTNIGNALQLGRLELVSPRSRFDSIKVMVLLSDGIANVYPGGGGWQTCGSSSGCSAARDYARDQAQYAADDGIVIYTIGLGSNVDDGLLQEIADIAGGSYVWAPSAGDLDATFQQIANAVRIRFTE